MYSNTRVGMMLSQCFPFFGHHGKRIKTGRGTRDIVIPSAFVTCDSWDYEGLYMYGNDSSILQHPSSSTAAKKEEEKVMEDEEEELEQIEGPNAAAAAAAECNSKENEKTKDTDLPLLAPSSDSNKQQSATVTMMADTKTHFPHFLDLDELELLSQEDDEYWDDDSDDEFDLLEDIKDKYRNQEDADVQVFLRIADRMSLTSLLHLLQGHVRAKNACPSPADQTTNAATQQKRQETQQQQPEKQRRQVFASKVTKKFRWAKDSDYKILAQVHLIEPVQEMTEHWAELWWNSDEFNNIRKELLKTITIFSKFRQDYVNSLEILYRGEAPNHVIEDNMKQLTRDSFARGLEGHMVPLVKELRTRRSRLVLQQQRICLRRGDDYDKMSDCLRKQSLLHTQMLTGFAERMGRCDEIEALTATMSHWEPEKE